MVTMVNSLYIQGPQYSNCGKDTWHVRTLKARAHPTHGTNLNRFQKLQKWHELKPLYN